MDFYELIRNRESIRDYAANHQPWRFLVISSKEMLKKVRLCYTCSWFQDAAHILIVAGNINESWVRQIDSYNSIETDLAIAMDHMILAAEYDGVATCWIEAYDPVILKKALSIKDNERIFAITSLGYPKKG